MKFAKKVISLTLILAIIASFAVVACFSTSASSTGSGLAEWALNAYYSGWDYVYGGASPGAVDCSGLIYAYCGGARGANSQLNAASEVGYISNGMPNIHGLIVYEECGHVGVYVGGGMAVDARGDDYGVCYQSIYTKSWTRWFKNSAVSYPTNGWEKFNGEYYYYENGEYITDTSRTIDGVTYYFDSNGVSSQTPSSSSGSSSSNTSSSNSSSSNTSSGPRTLRLGSSGDDVSKLQQRLTELGFYSGDITGYFGELTEAAYIDFQTAAGVLVDGISGASDQELLYSDYAPYKEYEQEVVIVEKDETEIISTSADVSYRLGDYGDEVVSIQQRLTELGYYNGEINGQFDDATLTAFDLFQGVNGVAQTGYADTFSQEVLFSIAALSNPYPLEDAITEEEQALTEESEGEEPTTEATENVDATVSEEKKQTGITNNATETNTEVVLHTTKTSSKALEGLANDASFTDIASPKNNFGFIIWLSVMIVVMIISFVVIYLNEKRKVSARRARIKARRYSK